MYSRPCNSQGGASIVEVPLPRLSWEAQKVHCESPACICPFIPLKSTVAQGLTKEGVPFFPDGMEISQNAISGHGARLNGSSLAVVEFILHTLPRKGTPAQVLFSYLEACFTLNPWDLHLFRCFIKADTKHLESHQRKLNALNQKLEK